MNEPILQPLSPPDPAVTHILSRELSEQVRGEVRFDDGSRALYAVDASNYRQIPVGVVIPRDLEDVETAFRLACKHGVPVLSRGGGTSLAGQCCNTALVIDCSKWVHGVEHIDVDARVATVLPGTNLDTLRKEAQKYGLTFGPDPATHTHCTIGGMIGNNSCGVHALLAEFYGKGPRTEDNVLELEILTYDGQKMTVGAHDELEVDRIVSEGGRRGKVYRSLRDLRDRHLAQIRAEFPRIPRRVSGYNLPALLPENGFNIARALVGTEGTCVFVLRARLHLVPHMKERVLVVLGYPDVFEAGDDIEMVRRFKPIGCEGIDQNLVDYMRKMHLHTDDLEALPDGHGWLLVEFGAEEKRDALAQAEDFVRYVEKHGSSISMQVYREQAQQEKLWETRESGLGATAYVPGEPDTWPGWEDAAVPPEKVGQYLREFKALLEKYGYDAALYGHFGQGCIHCRIDFDLSSTEGLAVYESFTSAATQLVVKMGGSISGEHGDGQSRGELLPRMYGEEIVDAFRAFKLIWDPRCRMNPGKVIDARPRTTQLRLGPDYAPWEPRTHFHYDQDYGRFSHATSRCVGVGKCRREEGGTMCPSFMVTHEEKHSTRGRAHLLFEMTVGSPLEKQWQSEEVREALELCLACKGCTSDCPVSVDMPTYKAEFFSHYFEGRLRPRQQYAFGLVYRWVKIGSLFPRVVNWAASTKGLSAVAKWIVNMAPERDIPLLAPMTFRSWFERHEPLHPSGQKVWLWVDTFNDHFHPRSLVAATQVLESAGYRVQVFEKKLCCGRPLYDYGMLDEAKALWRQILEETSSSFEPIVGIEPSCVAAFRDELGKLMGSEPRVERLCRRVTTLNEFLAHDDHFVPPRVGGRAYLQAHCHQKAVVGMKAEQTLFRKMGVDAIQPNDSCCGMAGSFGFEKEKYQVSQEVGERRLFPALDKNPEVPVIADGFSCREQVRQRTGVLPLHSAELLALGASAVTAGAGPLLDGLQPVVRATEPRPWTASLARWATVSVVSALLLGACWIYGL